MKLSEIKNILKQSDTIQFVLPSGQLVPSHFHITEVGKVNKKFIDCGGTLRQEEVINLQLWNADDYDHRLHPDKMLDIIELSEKLLEIGDLEIEVEYQGNTIEKYGLDHDQNGFQLISKQTDCLAKENCGVPEVKPRVRISDMGVTSCTPNSGCC